MDSFAFALNTTMPVFLVILLGWFLRRVGVLNAEFCKPANQYVFKCSSRQPKFLSIAKWMCTAISIRLFCLFLFRCNQRHFPRHMGVCLPCVHEG